MTRINARLAGRLERYHATKTATPLHGGAKNLLPPADRSRANETAAWKVQARRADGALVFDGYIKAGSRAAAQRAAARHWPGCGIRIKAPGSADRQPGPSTTPSTTTTRSL